MEITILKGKDRSEEMREFKEEMRRAIKEAEAVLKIKEEKKKRDDHNSELDEARKAAFEYIEKKWMKKV